MKKKFDLTRLFFVMVLAALAIFFVKAPATSFHSADPNLELLTHPENHIGQTVTVEGYFVIFGWLKCGERGCVQSGVVTNYTTGELSPILYSDMALLDGNNQNECRIHECHYPRDTTICGTDDGAPAPPTKLKITGTIYWLGGNYSDLPFLRIDNCEVK